jgi:hypothetical protein
MRKKSILFFAVLVAFALQLPDSADSAGVSAKDPDKILEIAKGYGSAALEEDSSGDPKIIGKMDGIKYVIYFYGCSQNKDCESIQFDAVWTMPDKPTLDTINEWNSKKRFGKAFVDSDGDPRIEMDFPLSEEVPTSHVENFFDWWKIALKQFEEHIR